MERAKNPRDILGRTRDGALLELSIFELTVGVSPQVPVPVHNGRRRMGIDTGICYDNTRAGQFCASVLVRRQGNGKTEI